MGKFVRFAPLLVAAAAISLGACAKKDAVDNLATANDMAMTNDMMAGNDMACGLAKWVTHCSPRARCARIRRRKYCDSFRGIDSSQARIPMDRVSESVTVYAVRNRCILSRSVDGEVALTWN